MSEDFARNFEEKDAAESIHREDEVRVRMAEYKSLKYVAHYLVSNGKALEVYGLTELRAYSDVSVEVDGPAMESIVQQELNAYSQTDLKHVTELGQVNSNQPDVFDQVVRAVEHPVGGEKLYFLDGPGGTGKSFLLEQILAHIRSQRKSAIAAAFGPYRTFDVSYPSQTNRAFHMQSSWQSQKAEQIQNLSLIIWNEAPTMNRGFFKAVVRVVRDIMKNESEPSGGKVIVFSGTTNKFYLGQICEKTYVKFVLPKICAYEPPPDPGSAADRAKFSEFLLQIGEAVNEDIGEGDICLPHDMYVFRSHWRDRPSLMSRETKTLIATAMKTMRWNRFQTITYIPV
ncbi:LOW QUALITY PROTEIN: Helitron helicase [Phytophthora megakarya]|uniref:ATP-dependent DNA helicase n=1 Tax=Phytophthora megakarya TaxID=4795 RepID=A0A225UIZ9_9STRA|nr:LOW QUALITY PROTEIN: Helitron helicase [Phytophthora megakarya]